MNYKLIYNNLINRAKNRNIDQYTERHHIIPQCIGGKNDASNLVDLTPEEHYVAHQLLVKMYPNEYKLVYAANMMTVAPTYTQRNNKTFGWIRRKLNKVLKERIISKETRKRMSESSRKRERVTCPHCGKSGLNGNMNRWHFDNCPDNPNTNVVRPKLTDEHKAKVSKSLLKAKWTISTCPFCNRTGKAMGINGHIKNCKLNPNRIKKIQPKFKCVHCGMMCTGTNLKRWHNDNCKMKPQ